MTIRLRHVDRLDTGRSITTWRNHSGRGRAGGWCHPAFGALTAAAPDFSATIAHELTVSTGELTIVTVADRPCVTRKQRSWLVAVSLMAATKQRGFPVSGGTTLTCTAVLFRRGGGERREAGGVTTAGHTDTATGRGERHNAEQQEIEATHCITSRQATNPLKNARFRGTDGLVSSCIDQPGPGTLTIRQTFLIFLFLPPESCRCAGSED